MVAVSPAPLVKVSVVPAPSRVMVPPVNVRPLAWSISNVRLSLIATVLRFNVWPTRLLAKTMVWLPVASSAAMAMASLRLTPLLTSMVAVSVALVT